MFPVLPLHPGLFSARGAVARFFEAARAGNYARAAEYLNLRGIPSAKRSQRGAELARELETILDRALWIDLEKVSPDPDGEQDDGLSGLRDSLGTIDTSTGPVEILVEHTEPGLQGDRSTGGTKPATLETGAEIKVPLFIVSGEKIKVDTRTGAYLGRA